MFTKKHYVNLLSAILILLADLYYLSFVELKTNYYVILLVSVFTFIAIIIFLDSVDYKFWGTNDVMYATSAILLLCGYTYYMYVMVHPAISIINIYYLLVLFILIAMPQSTDIKEKIISLSMFGFLAIPFILFQFDNPYYSKGFLNVFALYLTYKYVDPSKLDIKLIGSAIIIGYFFLTSTWGIYPLIIFMLFFFRNELKHFAVWAALIAIVGVLLSIYKPILINPFWLHLSSIHILFSLIMLFVCVYSGWSAASLKEVFFISGIIIFGLDMIYNFGVPANVRDASSTNTRMILLFAFDAIPYFLLSIEDSFIDYFRGKIMNVEIKKG